MILVGEMRDTETIATALTAAETGHLVFATLHTQDAPQTIDRIIDVFPSGQQDQIRIQLAGSLEAVVTQQLVLSASGFGRTPVAEVMLCNPAIRNLIRSAKTHQIYSLIQTGAAHGHADDGPRSCPGGAGRRASPRQWPSIAATIRTSSATT